jgi:endonuclease YncB( thermonuclease family)
MWQKLPMTPISMVLHRLTTTVLFLCTFNSAFADELTGRVVRIYDGDTFTLLTEMREQHKIRLAGIDAPEKRQSYGQRSKERLSELAFNRRVRVIWNKRDRYGRIVGKVFINDTDVNLNLVVSGLAWHFKHYEMEQSTADRRAYAVAEARARSARIGLWREANPVPPWNFRRGVR